jgi:hypothetical protein
MITFRKEISIESVPGIWTTNLSDDDVRTFWQEHAHQVPTTNNINISVFNLTVGFKYDERMVQFKDGACRWALLNDRNWLVYRTTFEWEIWRARRQELDELKEEQEQERAATRQLMRTESDHLMREARAAVLAKDYVTAERHLLARADLALEIERLKLGTWWSYGIIENISGWFTNFPLADNGIAFLKKYDCRATSFLSYANRYVFGPRRWRPDSHGDAEIEKVFDAATSLFPLDSDLHKQACLFWRRKQRFDLAIKYCTLAIEHGIHDDTKTGFVGRLKRLHQQAQSKKAE